MGLFEKPILTWDEPGEFVPVEFGQYPRWLTNGLPAAFALVVLYVAATKAIRL